MKIALTIFALLLPVIVLEFISPRGFLPASSKILAPTTRSAPLKVEISDETLESGLIFRHLVIDLPLVDVKHIQRWVAGAGASVAVTDYDGDGLSDVYVTSMMVSAPNRLFKNLGNGKFKDVTKEVFEGRSNGSYISMKSVFFDCDNDGDQDLLQLTSSCPVLYENVEGKKFRDVSYHSGLKTCKAIYGNVADINRDGFLDIIYASYHIYEAEYQMDHFSQGEAKNQFVALYINNGSCKFTEAKDTGVTGVGLTHAVGVLDTRGIDRKDLWFVTDTGSDKIFLDNGDGTFTYHPKATEKSFSRHGMAFDLTYEKQNSTPYVYVSHIFEPDVIIEGNALWELPLEGAYRNIAPEYGVNRCGHAWGGRFFDIDNDSDEDLVVSNGFFSQNPEKNYSFPLVLLGSTHRDYMRVAKNWPAVKDASLYGFEKTCLFLRDGEQFVVPEESTPLTESTLDGRAVATIDLENDGNTSILVSNQRQDLKLYRVRQKNNHNWIGFRLTGKCSNRDALGTKVVLHYADDFRTKWYYPTNGFAAQSESALKFGLGNHNEIEKVEVIWPLGFRETFYNLSLNKYHALTEGDGCVK